MPTHLIGLSVEMCVGSPLSSGGSTDPLDHVLRVLGCVTPSVWPCSMSVPMPSAGRFCFLLPQHCRGSSSSLPPSFLQTCLSHGVEPHTAQAPSKLVPTSPQKVHERGSWDPTPWWSLCPLCWTLCHPWVWPLSPLGFLHRHLLHRGHPRRQLRGHTFVSSPFCPPALCTTWPCIFDSGTSS